EQVERQPQRDVATALVELAAELPTGDVELVGLVARRQRHRVELRDVPPLDDMSASAGIAAQALDDLRDLVDSGALAIEPLPRRLVGVPVDPLLAVDRAEFAPFRGEGLVLDDSRFERFLRNGIARGA